MRKIDSIILHCTDTKVGQKVTLDDIRRWHVDERKFSDIGYHFIVFPDGQVLKGRNIEVVGAHCKGHNLTSVGIAYVGGQTKDGIHADTRTSEQKQSLLKLVMSLTKQYNINFYNIHCHNDFANKKCPCFDIQSFRTELGDYLNNDFFSMLKQEIIDEK